MSGCRYCGLDDMPLNSDGLDAVCVKRTTPWPVYTTGGTLVPTDD